MGGTMKDEYPENAASLITFVSICPTMPLPTCAQPGSEIFDLRSHDVEEVNHLLRSSHWKPDLVQLEPGLLEYHYLVAHLNKIQFARVAINRAMLHRSESPQSTITFVLPLNTEASYTWYGYHLASQQIIVHHANQEVDLAVKSANDMAAITLNVDDFLSSGMPEDQRLFDQLFSLKDPMLSVSQTHFLRLKHYLLNLFEMIQTQPKKASHPVMQTIIRNDFLPLLLECLWTSHCVPETGAIKRYRLVKKVESYMMVHLDQPLTLQDLCTAVDVKSRTLQMAFLEVFGISPMAYLKVQRLHGVRHELRVTSSKTATVVGIAGRWGFWHMGYFSQDYRRMFGELPSQTLKRE